MHDPTKTAEKPSAVSPVMIQAGFSGEQVTELLKMALQANRVSTLTVGMLLAQVRDGKLFATMGHATLEHYARERVKLGKSSLYYYLQAYDFAASDHPEWLNPGPDTFIPDLTDILGLVWIKMELAKPNVDAGTKTELETLKDKALKGEMKASDWKAFRARSQVPEKELQRFLNKMRKLREEGTQLEAMPSEIVPGLDDLIAILRNALKLPLRVLEGGQDGSGQAAVGE